MLKDSDCNLSYQTDALEQPVKISKRVFHVSTILNLVQLTSIDLVFQG